jgi:hypothetical protein
MAVADMIYRIAGDSSAFVRALGEADKSLQKLTKNASGVGKATAMLSAGASAVSGYLAKLTKDALDDADALGKLSYRTGIAVEDLARFEYALGLSDSSLEDFGRGAKNLNTILAATEAGNQKAATALTGLGVAATDVTGKARPMNDVILDVATAFKDLPDGAQKSKAAVDIFGKAGLSLIPMLNNGADGLATLSTEAEKLGLILGKETTDAAQLINDNLVRLERASAGLGREMLTALAPALSILTSEMAHNAMEAGEMKGRQELAIAIMKAMLISVRSLGFGFQYAGSLIARFAAGLVVELQTAATIVENLPGAVTAWATGTANEATRRIADALTVNRLALAKMEEERKALIAEYEKDVARIANAEAGAPTGEARRQQMEAEAKAVQESVKSGRERYEEELSKLQDLLNFGAIDQATFGKRQKQLEKQYLEAGKKSGKAFVDGAAEKAKEMAGVAERVMRDMQDAAAQIISETRNADEIYKAQRDELSAVFNAGLIDDDTANRRSRQIEAERDREANEKLNALKAQADQVRESVMTDLQRLEMQKAELDKLLAGKQIDRDVYALAVKKLHDELDPAAKKMRELEEAGKALAEQMRTPEQKLTAELDRINELLAAGVIDMDVYQEKLKQLFPDTEKKLTEMQQFGVDAAKSLSSAFADFLFDPINNSFEDMVKGFASALKRMVAEMIAKQAVFGLLKMFGASPEAFKAFGFEVPETGFAEGGYVAGPGTGTSDSIPARLSNGEYVMPADTVRHYGRDFMDALRAMRPQREAPVARFAEGGYVDGQGGGGGGGVRVVNVVDGSMVQDFLTSSAGEQVILNTIRRNRRQVSQVMA